MTPFPSVIATLLVSAACCLPSSATDVVADDAQDVYRISGAVLLDAGFPEARDASTCSGCHWRILHTCASGPLEDRRNCDGIACPIAAAIAEIWRADGLEAPPVGDPGWTYRGLACLPEPPAPVADVVVAVRDLAERAVPALLPTSQPAGSTLTGLPTVFRSHQPAGIELDPAVVAGVTVQIRTTPSWTWDFGQGTPLLTSDPGAVWPQGRVRHTYPRRGTYRIRVTAQWRATYTARGIPDLPVDGALVQSAWFDLRVREARRFLRTPQGA